MDKEQRRKLVHGCDDKKEAAGSRQQRELAILRFWEMFQKNNYCQLAVRFDNPNDIRPFCGGGLLLANRILPQLNRSHLICRKTKYNRIVNSTVVKNACSCSCQERRQTRREIGCRVGFAFLACNRDLFVSSDKNVEGT